MKIPAAVIEHRLQNILIDLMSGGDKSICEEVDSFRVIQRRQTNWYSQHCEVTRPIKNKTNIYYRMRKDGR